ncbi:MAG: hypothetical protein PHC70_02905 [Patescibacteria group bacterium]|nr:hypothetical protein [Patescibacteria group bacterium]
MSFEKPKNPFAGQENLPEKDLTWKSLMDLQAFHDSTSDHVFRYDMKDSPSMDFGLPDGRSFHLQKGGSMHHEKQIVVSRVDHEGRIYYETNEDKRNLFSGSLNELNDDGGTIIYFPLNGTSAKIQSIDSRRVYGLEDDGLHAQSPEQKKWDKIWSDFMEDLCDNEKFLKFLEKTRDIDYADEQENEKQALWAKRFKSGTLVVEDAEEFLSEVSQYWALAVKGSIPKEFIPIINGQRPPDDVYGYEAVRTRIQSIKEKLEKTLEEFDKRLDIFPAGNSYRQQAKKD